LESGGSRKKKAKGDKERTPVDRAFGAVMKLGLQERDRHLGRVWNTKLIVFISMARLCDLN
jgi:hypothetical protein